MGKKLVPSVSEMLWQRADENPQHSSLLYRDAISGSPHAITWAQFRDRVAQLADWLQHQGVTQGSKVAIYSTNRWEWFVADHAILAIGAVSVPIYPTLMAHEVKYILEHAECQWMFVDEAKRAQSISVECDVKVILMNSADSIKEVKHQVHLWEGIVAHNGSMKTPHVPADLDVATIVYTSGTTGHPKGVVHTHGNLRAAMEVLVPILEHGRTAGSNDRFFSFLPLSHVAERMLVEMGSLYSGAEVAFARSIKTVSEDLQFYRPSILLCVPRFWEKIQEGIYKKLEGARGIQRRIFEAAISFGKVRVHGSSILPDRGRSIRAVAGDLVLGTKLRKKLGLDRLRMALTGSAPTRREIMEFFAAMGICIREVYGLTENICLGALNDNNHMVMGSCGRAFPNSKIRIAEDGEILLNAPWMFAGYYKNESATAEVLDQEGWFHTGDLGRIDDDGLLFITGRKKELLKTSGGKYVAPVPIEDRLKECGLIADAMVVGDNEKFCAALISLSDEAFALSDRKALENTILNHLEEVNRTLASYESIKRLGVMKHPFSIEDGTLTPKLSLKRQIAAQKRADLIARVYQGTSTLLFE